MMKKLIVSMCCSFALFFSQYTIAGQFETFGDTEVHYISFPSTFLSPEIAKNYGIERSSYVAVVNISVLDASSDQKTPMKANVAGSARNLIGNAKELEFKEIVETGAIYYIATVSYANQETFRFTIDVTADGKTNTLKFQNMFYTD